MNLFVLSLALGTAFGGERLDEKPWNLGSYLGYIESVTLDKTIGVPGLVENNPNLYLEAQLPMEIVFLVLQSINIKLYDLCQ